MDILFEEERGFWSAVYELIATTKRPIIMTCNGKPVVSGRGGRGEWWGEGGIVELAPFIISEGHKWVSVEACMTPFHSIQILGMNWNATIRN